MFPCKHLQLIFLISGSLHKQANPFQYSISSPPLHYFPCRALFGSREPCRTQALKPHWRISGERNKLPTSYSRRLVDLVELHWSSYVSSSTALFHSRWLLQLTLLYHVMFMNWMPGSCGKEESVRYHGKLVMKISKFNINFVSCKLCGGKWVGPILKMYFLPSLPV